MELTAEVRARIDAHLDAVESTLRVAGQSRDQRRAVVDDLEAQILEMLAARGAHPTMEDVSAVLGKLDPPSAYAGGGVREASAVLPAMGAVAAVPPAVVPRRRYSRTAIWGLVCILVSILPWVVAVPLSYFTQRAAVVRLVTTPAASLPGVGEHGHVAGGTGSEHGVHGMASTMPTNGHATMAVEMSHHPSAWSSWGVFGCVGILVAPLALLGTILGWVAFAQIRGSGGMIVGTGMALFDGLFYPVVVLLSLAFVA